MKPESKSLRSKSYGKTTYVQMNKYKPRDWDYQSPKHQIIPNFIIGRYKKRIPVPKQEEFPVFPYRENRSKMAFCGKCP